MSSLDISSASIGSSLKAICTQLSHNDIPVLTFHLDCFIISLFYLLVLYVLWKSKCKIVKSFLLAVIRGHRYLESKGRILGYFHGMELTY
uniref:Uncharacterized protein n=1 Tax=Rhizophora mucronata TaxID=61149 RepID=A0A2P2Q9D2_RHIMU